MNLEESIRNFLKEKKFSITEDDVETRGEILTKAGIMPNVILQRNFDFLIGIIDFYGNTPYHIAVSNGFFENENIWKCNIKNKFGKTPVDIIKEKMRIRFKYLPEKFEQLDFSSFENFKKSLSLISRYEPWTRL